MSRNFEIRYWMQVFGVSRDELEQAVLVVGNHAESVRRYLHGLEQDRRRDVADGSEGVVVDPAGANRSVGAD